MPRAVVIVGKMAETGLSAQLVAAEAELSAGRLVALPWAVPFQLVTHLVWHRDRWTSPAVRAFLDLVRAVSAPAARGAPAEA
jgi:DNA-binding transcriptional LysR family regulator